jgi:DNA-binding PadR family transcriptional regulator
VQPVNLNGKVVRGNLEVVVLSLIASKPLHCYALIMEIKRRFGVYFGPSSVYPLLHSMEKFGFVKCEVSVVNGRLRKVYHITRDGLARLKALTQTVNIIASQAANVTVEVTLF